MGEPRNIIKCMAVGDGTVGKTCLLSRLSEQKYKEEYAPTIFDNFSSTFRYNDKEYDIHFIDTAGQEEFESLRTQMYGEIDVCLVCFSVGTVDSFTNLTEHWLTEIRKYSKNPSLILVGTKCDLRTDQETIDDMNSNNQIFVSQQMAEKLAKRNDMKYIECSARTKNNVEELQKTIVEANLSRPKKTEPFVFMSSSPFCLTPVMNVIRRSICCKMKCPYSTTN